VPGMHARSGVGAGRRGERAGHAPSRSGRAAPTSKQAMPAGVYGYAPVLSARPGVLSPAVESRTAAGTPRACGHAPAMAAMLTGRCPARGAQRVDTSVGQEAAGHSHWLPWLHTGHSCQVRANIRGARSALALSLAISLSLSSSLISRSLSTQQTHGAVHETEWRARCMRAG